MRISEVKVPDIGDFQDVEVLEVICQEGQSVAVEAVSYTHLTLPTKA